MADRSNKTEAPTPRRKREARKRGQVPRSPELVAWASVLLLTILVQSTFRRATTSLTALFDRAGFLMAHPDPRDALSLLASGLADAVVVLGPLVTVLFVIGVAGNVAQVGFMFSSKSLKPDLKRMNPLSGIKKLISPAGVWEGVKAMLKAALLGFLAYGAIKGALPVLMASGTPPLGQVASVVGATVLRFIRDVALVGLVLAVVDYALNRRRLNRQLRMSKREVKEEVRSSEGDPLVKSTIRQMQRRLSKLRMIAEVGKSDVVVVNPTHVAVALKYEASRGAPRVLAKGREAVAARIREEAERKSVPIVRDAPLARTLHAVCEVGDEIPASLYTAVARLLAFVFALRARGPMFGVVDLAGGGQLPPPPPAASAPPPGAAGPLWGGGARDNGAARPPAGGGGPRGGGPPPPPAAPSARAARPGAA